VTRRSQAERTAETRARILAAVVESIGEVGFQRTTANEIARRAGVTWGAVQHHFGGKDGILRAVLEDSFERFAARLEGIPVEGTPLEKRIDLFVDRAWEHFSSDHYRSTFEILLHYTGLEEPDPELHWQDQMFQAWSRIWRRLFGDASGPRRRSIVLQRYTIGVLSGLASLQTFEGPVRRGGAELELLKRALAREMIPEAGQRRATG